MQADKHGAPPIWSEETSQTFLDYGRYFVPAREHQIETICDLIPASNHPFTVFELCCGEGLLAEAILAQFPLAKVYGLDGSATMLQQTQMRLTQYKDRFHTVQFDLAALDWRHPSYPVHAVVSSLAIHHLDAQSKQQLFHDIHQLLVSGGVFVIADIIAPASARGVAVAAKAWDTAVRQRALDLNGTTDAFTMFEREKWNMYRYDNPEGIDQPSSITEQLCWLEQVGFQAVDVYWMQAGHVIFGGEKT